MSAPAYPDHPLAWAFALWGASQIERLAGDIARVGLRRPVVLYEGKVLCGRARIRACDPAEAFVGRSRPRFVDYLRSGGSLSHGDPEPGYCTFHGAREEAVALVWSDNAAQTQRTEADVISAHRELFRSWPTGGESAAVRRVRRAVKAGEAAPELLDAMRAARPQDVETGP